jgi:hypothetical protein
MKEGYVFKAGPKGTGYYKDEHVSMNRNTKKATQRSAPAPPPPAVKVADRLEPPSLSDIKLELIYQNGHSDPHSIELTFRSCDKFGVTDSRAIKIECANETKKLILSTSNWTKKLEVPLHYQIYTEKTQGWLHDDCLTVRLPIRL